MPRHHLQEGGGRKGLPKSFLNRFTRVHIELLGPQDLNHIAAALHPRLPAATLSKMVALLGALHAEAGAGRGFAAAGGPWDLNLRDLLRWCDLAEGAVPVRGAAAAAAAAGDGAGGSVGGVAGAGSMQVDVVQQGQQRLEVEQQREDEEEEQQQQEQEQRELEAAVQHFAGMLFLQRLRTETDRARVRAIFRQIWGHDLPVTTHPALLVTPDTLRVGGAVLVRGAGAEDDSAATGSAAAGGPMGTAAPAVHAAGSASSSELLLPAWQTPLLESAAHAVQRGWMCLLVGGSGSGKTSLAWLLASLAGRQLLEIPLTSATDTSDLLGSFEQVEPARKVAELVRVTQSLVQEAAQQLLLGGDGSSTTATESLNPSYAGANGAGVASQGDRVRHLALARSLQEAWDACATALRRAGSSGSGGSSSSTPAEAAKQLFLLMQLLQRLQLVPQELLGPQGSAAETLGHLRAQSASAVAGTTAETAAVVKAPAAAAAMAVVAAPAPAAGAATASTAAAAAFSSHLAAITAEATALQAQLASPEGQATAGRFEWVDGTLTRAIEHGSWVLLDNANLCNPTVLDRLNSLLEPGGSLFLNEAGGGDGGGGRRVTPHPGFRLFLALDPRHGEVSRAMRNRGIELFLLPPVQVGGLCSGAAAHGCVRIGKLLCIGVMAVHCLGWDIQPPMARKLL